MLGLAAWMVSKLRGCGCIQCRFRRTPTSSGVATPKEEVTQRNPNYFDLNKSGASDRCGWMLRRDDGLDSLG